MRQRPNPCLAFLGGVLCLALGLGEVLARELSEPKAVTSISAPATFSVELWRSDQALSRQDIAVTDLDGGELAPDVDVQVDQGRLTLATPETDPRQFVIRPRETSALQLPAERTVLPGGVVDLARADDPGDWFRPTLLASPLPVAWDHGLRLYSTRIFLGLRGGGDQDDGELERPVTVRFGFRGMAAAPLPDVTLKRAGIEHEQVIDLHFLPTTRHPVLELRSALGDADLEIDVLHRLELVPLQGSIPGFGLGTANVEVLHLEPHGAPAPVDRDTPVSLAIDGPGTVEPLRLVIPAGASSARFSLRASGLDDVIITAHAAGFSDSRTVHQHLPLLPLAAALVGGGLGGYSRRFSGGKPRFPVGARVLEGLLVALVAYVAAVLGVGHLGLPPAVAATEAGAFLVGAASGFAGVVVIEMLSKRLLPTQG
ncbi:MAG: hypothetical protein JJT90_14230 [Ectothiorhodospiraceae bacterium]|nr:hypothetical protein [Ectothiorhodospiraceae bacterium]